MTKEEYNELKVSGQSIYIDSLKTANDIWKAFDILQARAIEIGHPIVLGGESSVPLVVYVHDDTPYYVLVDKQVSSESKHCPHCNKILAPSDLPKSEGYTYTCLNCDENFTEQEVK